MLQNILKKVQSFEKEAHSILGIHEEAPSRVVILDATYRKVDGLSIKQDQLLRQSLRCVENILFRAAHILAWIALVDHIQEKLASDSFKKIKSVRSKWKINTIEDLWKISEFELVETCKAVGLLSEGEKRVIHGYLTKRNWCAHPSTFMPDYNQTLGFIADIIQTIETIEKKSYP